MDATGSTVRRSSLGSCGDGVERRPGSFEFRGGLIASSWLLFDVREPWVYAIMSSLGAGKARMSILRRALTPESSWGSMVTAWEAWR